MQYPNMPFSSTASTTSLLYDIKNLDFKSAVAKIKAYELDWKEVGISFSIGILSGFLFKRYLKSFLGLLVCGAVLLVLLEYYGIIMLDWSKVHSLTGIEPTQEAAINILQNCWLWIKVNKVPSISCGIGFLVGIKLG